jgi:hypothetical protein
MPLDFWRPSLWPSIPTPRRGRSNPTREPRR